MSTLNRLKSLTRALGLDARRFPADMEDFRALTTFFRNVETIVDVGAATGQFARKCRAYGFAGQIISLEPIKKSFIELSKRVQSDDRWIAHNYAAGQNDSHAVLWVSSNDGHSSSLAPMLKRHREAAPDIKVVGSEEVKVRSLDSLLLGDETPDSLGQVGLKIDAQGHEENVLLGSEQLLSQTQTVILELSLVPLYEGAWDWREAFQWLEQGGFTLSGIIPGFTSVSGRLMQFDGIFERSQDRNQFKE
jgi:FkbM family methyltransferase